MARIIACLLAVVVLSTQAQATVIYYLEIDGVKGASEGEGHEEWIDLNSFGVGVYRESDGDSGGSRGYGIVFSDFVFSAAISKASPEIFKAVVMGTPIPLVTLDIVNAGFEKQAFAQWELKNTIFTSYQTSGSSGETLPVETYTVAFTEITYTYTEFGSDGKDLGSVLFHWNLETNTSSTAYTGTVESFQFLTGTVPEPGTLALLGLGGLALLRRKRK